MQLAATWGAVLRALEARQQTDPESMRAEILEWLREGGERLAEFKRVNGRGPRNAAERGLVLPP